MIGYTGFAWSDVAVKVLTLRYSIYQIIAIDMALSALFVLAIKHWTDKIDNKVNGPQVPMTRKNMILHILRGVLNLLISILFVFAISKSAIADVYTLVFSKPFFAVLLTMILYGEHMSLKRWIFLVAGFMGVLIALRPGTQGFDPTLLAALGVAFLAALMFVISKSLDGESMFRLGFYPACVTAVLCAPLTIPDFIMPSISDWPFFIISGICISVGIIGVTLAYRMAPSSIVSPFHYSQMIWGLIFGALLFGDYPDIHMITGAIIIMASGLLLVWSERKKSDKA